MSEPVLQVRDLHVTFAGGVRAVRGVNFELARGEVLGIVGESGSGKSASAQAVMGLLPANAEVVGSVKLGGKELVGLGDAELSQVRGKSIAMVFQDPLSALTPVYTIGDQITEAILIHNDTTKDAAHARAVELLELVGIPRAGDRAKAFPHEFSGGMRQRVMIAMALSCEPKLLLADEPTTALDVTIQAQILELIKRLRQELGMAIIMITHDLGVVAGIADRINVMYAGYIVETATADEIFHNPRHPYTLGLLKSIPRLDEPRKEKLVPIEGLPPDLVDPPKGCPFQPRCPYAIERCVTENPSLEPVVPGHRIACWVDVTGGKEPHAEPVAQGV